MISVDWTAGAAGVEGDLATTPRVVIPPARYSITESMTSMGVSS
ncbi:hypothetical protein A7982_12424 [Minicystis rosea]|nr:hypothetical protein A7982_12424 [Minicystis rosea]